MLANNEILARSGRVFQGAKNGDYLELVAVALPHISVARMVTCFRPLVDTFIRGCCYEHLARRHLNMRVIALPDHFEAITLREIAIATSFFVHIMCSPYHSLQTGYSRSKCKAVVRVAAVLL